MSLPRMHDEREYCLYHNDLGQSVGECALEVRGWLAEHPEYQGRIYGDWDTGGPRDHFDATEMFMPEAEEHAETVAEPGVSGNGNLTLDTATNRFLDAITKPYRRVA